MADMQTADRRTGTQPQRGSPRRLSIRVDLTPMVDLGFLLITFFMLTTILSKPQVMPVAMPDKTPLREPPVVSPEKVLTLLLGGDDKVFWYEDPSHARLDSVGYGADGLRRVVLDKKERVTRRFGEQERPDPRHPGRSKSVSPMVVIIKAAPGARYKNMVDVLDEMHICQVAHYVILDISEAEKAFVGNPAAGLQFTEAQQLAAAYKQR